MTQKSSGSHRAQRSQQNPQATRGGGPGDGRDGFDRKTPTTAMRPTLCRREREMSTRNRSTQQAQLRQSGQASGKASDIGGREANKSEARVKFSRSGGLESSTKQVEADGKPNWRGGLGVRLSAGGGRRDGLSGWKDRVKALGASFSLVHRRESISRRARRRRRALH
jgi:hypothetical protein